MSSRATGTDQERTALREQKAEQRQKDALQRIAEQRAAEAHKDAKIKRLRALRLARDEAEATAAPQAAPAKSSRAAPKARSASRSSGG